MDTDGRFTGGGFSALPSGTVLDRYRIESVIAAGGFGVTYLASHVTLGHPVAIKEHFPRQLAYREASSSEIRPTDPETYSWALERFVQEGQTLARCRHPGVVSVADVFSANGSAYMVLAYENGSSFRDWLAKLGSRTPTQAELDKILVPLLDALAYVHSQGLLHRDIAPDNIMIREDGSPCLIDFGAARQAVAERSAMMSAIVKSGFSPPEQYTRSGRSQGPWSDIYALGATLYRAVTGEVPTEATDRQLQDDLLPVADLVVEGKYRSKFLRAIDQALILQPNERPRSIEEWREKLLSPTSEGKTGIFPKSVDFLLSPEADEITSFRDKPGRGVLGEIQLQPRSASKSTLLIGFGTLICAIALAAAYPSKLKESDASKDGPASPSILSSRIKADEVAAALPASLVAGIQSECLAKAYLRARFVIFPQCSTTIAHRNFLENFQLSSIEDCEAACHKRSGCGSFEFNGTQCVMFLQWMSDRTKIIPSATIQASGILINQKH